MPSAEYGPFLHFEEKSDMTRKSEYSCLPHAAAVAQMQARSVLRQVRVRAAPACPPEPPQKPVCRQFSRCEGCPYPAHGFLCCGSGDDCMRTRVEKLNREEKAKYENQSGAL